MLVSLVCSSFLFTVSLVKVKKSYTDLHEVIHPSSLCYYEKNRCYSFLKIFIYLFLFLFWLCWVFVSVRGPSPAVASGGHPPSRHPPPLRSTGSRRAGSVVVAHGPSCSAACGIPPDQGSNPCPPH